MLHLTSQMLSLNIFGYYGQSMWRKHEQPGLHTGQDAHCISVESMNAERQPGEQPTYPANRINYTDLMFIFLLKFDLFFSLAGARPGHRQLSTVWQQGTLGGEQSLSFTLFIHSLVYLFIQ